APAMRHEYNLLPAGTTGGDLSFLPNGMIRIGKGQCQRVEKDCSRFLKGNSVLSPVAPCLFRIPLVDHNLSLPHPRHEAKRSADPCATPLCYENGCAKGTWEYALEMDDGEAWNELEMARVQGGYGITK